MPYELSFYHCKRVIYLRNYGELTSDDVREGSLKMVEMIKMGTPPVYVLIDNTSVTQSQARPQNLREMFPTDTVDAKTMMIFFGMDIIGRFFISLVMQLMKMRYHFEPDLAAALAFIRRHDSTLADLPDPVSESTPTPPA